MEKLILVFCLAVGIRAVPIPDSEVVSAPAGPVMVLTPDGPPLTNAVESYVIIEENQGKEPEAEIYTVYSPLMADLSLSDHSVQAPVEIPEHAEPVEPKPHVEPVGDPAPSDESESASSSAAPAPEEPIKEEPAPEEPITEEPFAVEPAPIIITIPKPDLVSLQEASSSSPFGGIISFLNPFHLSIPSMTQISLPNFIPIKWPWSSKLSGTSSSNYIALRTPYHVYYAN